MPDKFQPEQQVRAAWAGGEQGSPARLIEAAVVAEEKPGLYRLVTNMGITLLLPEEAIDG